MNTQSVIIPSSPKMESLCEMGAFGFVAVHTGRLNIDDLLEARPGGIIRVDVKPTDSPFIGCIAGWISEDEPC
jgi:hypothetical protein